MIRAAVPLAALAALAAIPTATAQATAPREGTDVYIRRLAGLPAESARGDIEILDVGHHAMETMVSVVAHHIGGGWTVSYACAQSPFCANGADHLAREYRLSAADGAEVDRLVATIETGRDPGGEPTSPRFIGGWMSFVVNDGPRSWQFSRIAAGPVLGRLRELLKPPA